jgi:hypothetical protein
MNKTHVSKQINLEVKAKKDGQMDDGDYFCYTGEIYWACVAYWPEEDDEEYYDVEDELCKESNTSLHGMDKEFFNEYFEVLNENVDGKSQMPM